MVLNSKPPVVERCPSHDCVSRYTLSARKMRELDSCAAAWQPMSNSTPRISPFEELVMW
jgi:hypothetical protein